MTKNKWIRMVVTMAVSVIIANYAVSRTKGNWQDFNPKSEITASINYLHSVP